MSAANGVQASGGWSSDRRQQVLLVFSGMTAAVRRHALACGVGGGGAFAVFLWSLWAAPGGFLDRTPFGMSGFYDAQARAWFDGRWYGDAAAFSFERIAVDGHYYMYFGPWPSLLRAPVLAVTSTYDGRLTRFSLLLAVAVLMAGVGRLLWQVRSLRGTGVPSRWEQAAVAAFLLAVGCGSAVVVLSASVWVYDEAMLWGVAWAVWSLSWCITYLVRGSTLALVLASATATLAILSRTSSGVVGVVVLGAVFGVQLVGSARHGGLRAFGHRVARVAGFGDQLVERRPWPAAVAFAFPIVAYAAVNWAKFGSVFAVPFDRQDVVNRIDPYRARVLDANGDDLLALGEIPTNLVNYFRPNGFSIDRLFPFVDFSPRVVLVGSPVRDLEALHASMTVTATLLLALAVIGLAAVCLPRFAASSDLAGVRVLRMPAAATVISLGPMLMFPSVSERYTVDFTPALVLLGATGLYVAGARLHGRRTARTVVAVLGVVVLGWNVASNLALTLNYQRGYQGVVSPADRANWVRDRVRWTERLGIDPRVTIVRWDPAVTPRPRVGPLGSFLVVDDCREIMLSNGSRWLELDTDDRSLCRTLVS
jgi:hypothetical protein